MRKSTIIIIAVLVCCSLIALGVFGLCRSSHGAEAQTTSRMEKSPAEASEKTETESRGLLLDVRIPDSLKSQIKDYEGFRVSFNSRNRTPNWVAWELLRSETSGASSRSNKFWTDAEIENCPSTADYTRSGYDRGHLCPAADQKWSDQAMVDCFVMANMTPQARALNSGAWATLETKERAWAQRDSALVIVAGPVYSDQDREMIGSGVRVPGAFFKVLIAPYLPEPRGIAFVYPNMSAPGNMQNYVMTIDDVEKLTGFDFFYNLPDDIENEVESKASFAEWNKR